MTTPQLPLAHDELTKIVDQPTNATLQLLQQQLYTNAMAVHSNLGGGENGHLALVMPADQYLTRTQVAFVPPPHPGADPVHPPGATAPQITEANRQYKQALDNHALYKAVATKLRSQILEAVDTRYLLALKHPDFGFADVSAGQMLAHLKAEYGTLTSKDIEANRKTLEAEWNPDNPIEDLWHRISEAHRIATAGGDPISEATAIRLTLNALEAAGVYSNTTDRWHEEKPNEATWTMAEFRARINHANKERQRKLTATQAGYHGANAAANIKQPPKPTGPTTGAINQQAIPSGCTIVSYCWTHGVLKNLGHTSATCTQPKEGHQATATFDNRMGGTEYIMKKRPNNRTDKAKADE